MKDLKLTENEADTITKIVNDSLTRLNEFGKCHWNLTVKMIL